MYSIFVIEPTDTTKPGFYVGYSRQRSLRAIFHQNSHRIRRPKNELHIRWIAQNLSLETAKERALFHKSALEANDNAIRHAKRCQSQEHLDAKREQFNRDRRVATAWRFFLRQIGEGR